MTVNKRIIKISISWVIGSQKCAINLHATLIALIAIYCFVHKINPLSMDFSKIYGNTFETVSCLFAMIIFNKMLIEAKRRFNEIEPLGILILTIGGALIKIGAHFPIIIILQALVTKVK
ncbi:hypothetical protein ABE527_19305 [Brucella sp. TWI432]